MPQNQSNIPLSPKAASATGLHLSKDKHEYMIEFTPEELRRSRIQVIAHNISIDHFDDRELPTDVHIVEFRIDNKIVHDAVRANSKSEIFDEYYFKVKELGGVITAIKHGYGRIKPRLYGKIGKEPKN